MVVWALHSPLTVTIKKGFEAEIFTTFHPTNRLKAPKAKMQ